MLCLFLEICCHSSGGMLGGLVDPFRTRTLPLPGKVSNPKPLVSVPGAIPVTDNTASCDTRGSAGGREGGWGMSDLAIEKSVHHYCCPLAEVAYGDVPRGSADHLPNRSRLHCRRPESTQHITLSCIGN